ncbi:XRE family transcriptional regulator [Alphaproteobacteria bacterium]|nr:XRE family transcriptional regulator [Alphaproteobacteria bacterium]
MSPKSEKLNLDAPQVGRTIQRLRQAYNLSLGHLAEQSGVSKSIISQIERNEANPALATIWRLSQALETSIEEILQDDSKSVKAEALSSASAPIIMSEDGLCRLRVLGPIDTVEWLQWYEFTAEPGGKLISSPHEIGSKEHLTVVEGRLTVECGDEVREVLSGETLRFRGDLPHIISNPHEQKAKAWMVDVLKSSVMV